MGSNHILICIVVQLNKLVEKCSCYEMSFSCFILCGATQRGATSDEKRELSLGTRLSLKPTQGEVGKGEGGGVWMSNFQQSYMYNLHGFVQISLSKYFCVD